MKAIFFMHTKNDPAIVRAWTFYDWANSVYSLVIVSSIFPVYYQAVTTGSDGSDLVDFFGFRLSNSVLMSYAISLSYMVVTPLLPLLCGIADYTGNKKHFMRFFTWLGGIACSGLYFFEGPATVEWAIICLVFASIGWSGSVVFYDAYLPEIVTPDQADKVSARGFSMGYFGSIILLISCILMMNFSSSLGFQSEASAIRFGFLLVGIWWIGFAQIPLKYLPAHFTPKTQKGSILMSGYKELIGVWHRLKKLRDLKIFLIAFFFYNMGVQTVMYLAALFGSKELKLSGPKLIGTVLLIQLVGAAGAWLFARLSGKVGNKKTLMILITAWSFICLTAYFITVEWEFYSIAFSVGMVMGGIQALSRATYSKLIPADSDDYASFFSFYDVVYNISILLGTFSYGLVEHITGSMRNSTLVLTTFFLTGLFFLRLVRMPFINKAGA